MEERLQKIIAQAGICSRRDAEQLILDRAVTVNGKIVAQLGAKADPQVDTIELRGYGKLSAEQLVYILINKPENVVTTVDDPLGRRTVIELLDMVAGRGKGPEDLPRLYPVGRLDFDAQGALILTNDGELAHMLMHPSHNLPKTYEVKVKGLPTEEELQKLRNGVRLPGHLPRLTAGAVAALIEQAHAGLAKGGRRRPHRSFTSAPGQESRQFNKVRGKYDNQNDSADSRSKSAGRPQKSAIGHRSDFARKQGENGGGNNYHKGRSNNTHSGSSRGGSNNRFSNRVNNSRGRR